MTKNAHSGAQAISMKAYCRSLAKTMADPAITGFRQHAVNSHEIVSSRAITLLLQHRARQFVRITLMAAQRSFIFPLRNSMSHMAEREKIAGGRAIPQTQKLHYRITL